MEYTLTIENQNYIVNAEGENQEKTALLIKALDSFYDVSSRYEAVKFEYDSAKMLMEQMFGQGLEEFGLKSIKSPYYNATYIPKGKDEKVEVLDEEAVLKLLDELGLVKDTVYKLKDKKGRKASVRWSTK